MRRVDDMIFTLEVDKRPFFRAVRNDLQMEQNDLFDLLFPRRPDKNPAKQDP